MADCALCGHPRDDHTPRCIARVEKHDYIGTYRIGCSCPGWEPPEDEENN
ncbi:hypothetical protein [Mycolicibacterium conceptionense]|nr:hypothetical protein [Mycolicibacterium conceptionense]